MGQEHTFGADTADPRAAAAHAPRARATAWRAACGSHGLRARTVTLKYRDEDFQTVTRAETLEAEPDAGEAIFKVASRLFAGVHARKRVRLLGIYASGFGATPRSSASSASRPPAPTACATPWSSASAGAR